MEINWGYTVSGRRPRRFHRTTERAAGPDYVYAECGVRILRFLVWSGHTEPATRCKNCERAHLAHPTEPDAYERMLKGEQLVMIDTTSIEYALFDPATGITTPVSREDGNWIDDHCALWLVRAKLWRRYFRLDETVPAVVAHTG